MFAVGIDISTVKSTVKVLQSKVKVPLKSFEVAYTSERLNHPAGMLNDQGDSVRIVMDHADRYCEAVA